jgi:hypothetical protein
MAAGRDDRQPVARDREVIASIDERNMSCRLSTDHNAMPLGPLTSIILPKTERMRGIQIDPAARTARVEAGAVWAEFVEAAARHGPPATTPSSSPAEDEDSEPYCTVRGARLSHRSWR